jgi:hypothetical protein
MADFPVFQPAPQPSAAQTLAQVLGIKQAQQNLDTGAIQQQTASAESQQAQQKNSELQAVGNLTRQAYSSGNYKLPDGSFDNQKFANDVSALAPVYGQQIANDATMRAGEIYKNQQTLFNLKQSQREMIGNAMGSWAADPTMNHTKFIDGIEGLRGQFKDNPDVSRMLTSMTTAMPNTDGPALQQALRNAAIAANSPTAAQTNPQVGTYQGAKGIQAFQSNPQAAGGVANVGKPLGPQGIAPQVVALPNGQISVIGGGGGAPSAGAQGPAPAPGAPRTAAQDAPPPNAPKAVQDAYLNATQQANAHVETIRNADADYGTNSTIANQIRKLSQSTDTGPGTETWHHVLGALGAPVGANNVADYQLLGAYLDRQAAGARSAMGLPNTNQGTTESKAIAGNTEYQAKALQDKNDLTQSLVEGLHQYREGLDRVAGFSGQASPQAINQFKSAWAGNFDPNVYKGELAYKRSKADGDAFVKSLTPQEAQSLAAKRAALSALSKGQLQQQ